MKAYAIKRKLGENKGSPRVWLEGNQPQSAGFLPKTRYSLVKNENEKSVVLTVSSDGERVVSMKMKNGKEYPVIDINSKEILSMFAGCECVKVLFSENQIVLMPVASDAAKEKSKSNLVANFANGQVTTGSVCHGGGILTHAVHHGLVNAGVKTKTSFVIEMRDDLVAQSQKVNDAIDSDTVIFEAPLQEIAYDFSVNIPCVDILEMGLPCSGASVAGRAKNKTDMAESHPHVGWLVAPAMAILARVNPAIVLIENVPAYSSSASAEIMRGQLKYMGYTVNEAILDGSDFGSLEHRKRWCVVAVREGLDFDFNSLIHPKAPKNLGEVLDNSIPRDDPRWKEMAGLKAKQERDKAAGKGFMMQKVTEETTKCPTITKGYQKNRSTDPKVQHPENKDLLRLFTPAEHARIKRIPEVLILGIDSATMAHEILGQSIIYTVFESVAQGIGESIKNFDAKKENESVNKMKCSA